jgi:hypothetical protein
MKSLRKIVIENWLAKMQRINPELWCPVDMSQMTYEIVVASYMTTKRDVNGRLLEVEELIVAQGKQPSCMNKFPISSTFLYVKAPGDLLQ